MQGKFIVIEGLEGAGKSTAMQTVVDTLKSLGVNDIVFTREPGGTPLAEKLRHLIKHETEEPVTDKAELLMLYAARIQLVEKRWQKEKLCLAIVTICLRRPIKVVGVSLTKR